MRGVGVTDVNGWRLVIVSGVRKVRNDVCLVCGVVGGVSASEEKEKEIGGMGEEKRDKNGERKNGQWNVRRGSEV